MLFNALLVRLFNVSQETFNFVSDNRKRYLKRLAIVLPLTAWAALFYQLNPLFIKWQVDSLTPGWTAIGSVQLGQVWYVFIVITGTYLALSFLDKLFEYFKNNALFRINQETESYLEDKFNTFLSKFDGAFLSSENNLRLVRNLQWRLSDIERKFTELLQKGIETVIGMIALAAVLPLIHPYLLGIIVLAVVFSMYLDYVQNQSWRQFELLEARQSEQRNELRWRIIWYFNQLLSNGWIGQIFSIYRGRRNSLFQTQWEQQRIDRRYGLLKDMLDLLSFGGASLIAGYLFITGKIEIGTFVIFGFYIDRLKTQLNNIGSLFRTLFELRFELFRFDFLLHIKPKLDYSQIDSAGFGDLRSITISNLSFTYPKFFQEELEYLKQMQQRVGILQKTDTVPDSAKIDTKTTQKNLLQRILAPLSTRLSQQSVSVWNRKRLQDEFRELEDMFKKAEENQAILKGISVKLHKGQIYALVGYNGAGKTTLTRLLKRSIDPSDGSILINGTRNLKTVDPAQWRNYLASLEQQSFLWESLSVRENLLLGYDGADQINDDTLWKAIEKVGLKEAVTDLDAILGEGLELSGGQSQLLEIARVYVQKKPFIILDEGTNQLDAVRESQILEVLQEIKKQAIVIFITHRMTTCNRCDQVLVLEDGILVAQDEPNKLLNSSTPNLYQRFWNLQVQGKDWGKESIEN